MLTNFMDPVIAAQVRLEQAVSRLEEALARGKDGDLEQSPELAAATAEIERVRAENAALQAAKRTATERLDVAISRLQGLIES